MNNRNRQRFNKANTKAINNMENTLALVTTNQQSTKFKMIVISWVHTTTNERYIEISATNTTLGQLLVRITSPNTTDVQRRLSEFHDKLLSAIGRFNTQITAYTGTANLPQNLLNIDLSIRVVYLKVAVVGYFD
jgi:hypothetical protein